MDALKSVAESIPFIKKLSKEFSIDPTYLLGAFALLSAIVIQKTAIGNLYACLLSLYLPAREAILSIQSPTPKLAEQKKLLVIFIAFAAFTVLESLGIRRIVPLFLMIKVIFLFWMTYDERHANAVSDLVLKNIPQKWLNCGDTIDAAVKKAAKAVEEKIDISIKKSGSGTVEISKK